MDLLTGPPVPGLSVSGPCEILLDAVADTGRLRGILENPFVLTMAWLTFLVGVVQISTWS